MYITSYKKTEVELSNNNIIDALFSDAIIPDLNILLDTNESFKETITTVRPDNEVTSTYITEDKIKELYGNLFIKYKDTYFIYDTFRIPKKTHGFRTIEAPCASLKELQTYTANMLANDLHLVAHNSAWAYVKGRDVVKAIEQHTSNDSRWYLKIDLKDFFGSCTTDFIKEQLFKIYPIGCFKNNTDMINLINLISFIATNANGKLPQGTPLSPSLTNYIMIEFDYLINKGINKLVNENKLFKQRYIYTRYADDIIISGKNKFDFTVILNMLEELFKDTPLKINREKTRFGSNAGRNWNLGLMCNKDMKATVGFRKKKLIKTMIFYYINYKRANEKPDKDFLYELQGQLAWLNHVEPDYFKEFIKYYNRKYNLDIVKELIKDIKNY